MTLVLGCLTRDYVVQVAHCRTVADDSGPFSHGSQSRCALFCDEMAFTHCGLSHIARKSTDVWMAESMGPAGSLVEALHLLRDRSTDSFQRPGSSAMGHGHVFAGVGFIRFKRNAPLQPVQATVSNCLKPGGGKLPRITEDFQMNGLLLPREISHVVCPPIGISLPESLINFLSWNINRLVKQRQSPVQIMKCLSDVFVDLSRTEVDIGTDLLGMIVPRPVEGRQLETNLLAPVDFHTSAPIEQPIFLRLSPLENRRDGFTPNLACNGNVY